MDAQGGGDRQQQPRRNRQAGHRRAAEPRLAVGDYRFESRVKIGAGARFTGANYGDGGGTPAQVPSFVLVDAMVGYDVSHWNLALNVRNLTNKTYIANCGYGNCYYGEPRTVVATATYRW